MNIIEMLKSEHRKVENLFTSYFDGNHDLAELIADELMVHMVVEEAILYPVIKTDVENGEELARHAEQEHNGVKAKLTTFRLDPDNTLIAEQIRSEIDHHVQEEETNLFPALEEALDEDKLSQLGEQAQEFKEGH